MLHGHLYSILCDYTYHFIPFSLLIYQIVSLLMDFDHCYFVLNINVLIMQSFFYYFCVSYFCCCDKISWPKAICVKKECILVNGSRWKVHSGLWSVVPGRQGGQSRILRDRNQPHIRKQRHRELEVDKRINSPSPSQAIAFPNSSTNCDSNCVRPSPVSCMGTRDLDSGSYFCTLSILPIKPCS